MRSARYRILRSYKDTPHGPSDRIRTCGILLPKQARYQLRYTRLFSFLSGWADSPKPLGEKGCDGNRDRKFLIFLRNPPDQKTRKTVESIGKSCLVQFISVGII